MPTLDLQLAPVDGRGRAVVLDRMDEFEVGVAHERDRCGSVRNTHAITRPESNEPLRRGSERRRLVPVQLVRTALF